MKKAKMTWRRTFKNDLERAGTTWDEATTLAKGRDAWKLFAAHVQRWIGGPKSIVSSRLLDPP